MTGRRTTVLLATILILLGGLTLIGFTPALATFAGDIDILEPDDPVEDEHLVMEPHPGPNGEYAELNGDDEIEIVADQVNPTSQSNFSDVFTIWNNASSTAVLNISHDNEAVVVFDSNATDEFGDIQSDEGITLAPDETVAVGFHIDAAETYEGQTLLEYVTFHAEWKVDGDTVDSSDESTPVQPGGDDPSSDDTSDSDDSVSDDDTSDSDDSVSDDDTWSSDDSVSDDDTWSSDDSSDDAESDADTETPSDPSGDDAGTSSDSTEGDGETSEDDMETPTESPATDDDDGTPMGELAGFSGAALLFLLLLLILVAAGIFLARRVSG